MKEFCRILVCVSLFGLFGCQRANPAIESEDNETVRGISNLGLLKQHAEVASNIAAIISSAIRDLGISFKETQHGEGGFEYQAEANSGESILIKAAFLGQGRKIYIEVWGEEPAV